MAAFGTKLRTIEGGKVAFWCPGCNCMHAVGVQDGCSPRWTWNGSGDAPTFKPSILVTYDRPSGKDICHSFVTEGRIQFLGDFL